MFRLIKLAMYALVGYVLYELYLGMTQEQGGRSFGGGGGGGQGAFGRGEGGSAGALTGGGAGTSDTASDYGGAEMRHTVGRGVISGS